MAEMAITPQQYEASMRRHGTRDWTREDDRVTTEWRRQNGLGEFAPEPELQIDADSQRSPDQRPRPKSDDSPAGETPPADAEAKTDDGDSPAASRKRR